MHGSRKDVTRREFMATVGGAAAASAITAGMIAPVHAAGDDTIRVALIGCGGRGTGAASEALSTKSGPVKLVAMADIVQKRLDDSLANLKGHGEKVDVPPDRRFIGFDGYRKAMDCLKPGDMAIFATPPAFRWVHFAYAIEKGLHVFMEKPVTVDGPTTKRMLALAEASEKKGLKVGVGLMVRHCRGRRQLYDRIKAGEIGEIAYMRAYRMGGGAAQTGPRPASETEVLYQTRRFHSFLWASGGVYSDYYIHQIDECSWMKDAWPVRAHALGGRHYRGGAVDQNLDTYDVEYIYEDGMRFFFQGRNMDGCHGEFASYVHGSKGCAIVSTHVHTPGKVRIFSGQNFDPKELKWAFPQPEPNPYQLEWDDLMEAIRAGTPYNEAKRGAMASVVTSMGRMAAHTGQVITLEQMMECPHEFAPDVDKLTMEGTAPLVAGPDGKYPVPMPGIKRDREY